MSQTSESWRSYTHYPNTDSQQATFFICPRCKHVEPCYLGGFQRVDLDKTQICISCKKYSPVHHWKCECGSLWHNCYQHRWCGRPAASAPPSKQTARRSSYCVGDLPVPKRRKVIPTLSFEELLAQDIDRADLKRKERSSERILELGVIPITTQINPSFLTAGLKRRFVDIIYAGDTPE